MIIALIVLAALVAFCIYGVFYAPDDFSLNFDTRQRNKKLDRIADALEARKKDADK